jgi:hypothetical protein
LKGSDYMGLFDDNFRDDLASSLNYQAAPIDKPRPTPTGETWQQAGMTQYRGYFYELVDVRAGLGVGGPSWTYSLYPPEAADSAFFDYGMVMRVQGGFSQQSAARADVKAWVDGLLVGTNDASDTGDNSGIIDIGLPGGLPDAMKPSDPVSTPPSSSGDPEMDMPPSSDGRILSEDQTFLIIGLGVAIYLVTFIQTVKRGT